MSGSEKTSTRDDTFFAVDVTIYQIYIDKTFAQTCRYSGEILVTPIM